MSLIDILIGLACVASCVSLSVPLLILTLFALSYYYPSPLMTIPESVINVHMHACTHIHKIAEASPSYINCCSLSSSCTQATLISLIKKLQHGDCLSATRPLRVLTSSLKASSVCDLSECLSQVSFYLYSPVSQMTICLKGLPCFYIDH